MEALFDALARTFQNLSRESAILLDRMTASLEPWHIALFVFAMWLLAKLTGPGVRRG